METPSVISAPVFNPVPVDSVNKGDVVYISNKPNAVPYIVLDACAPYVYIENTQSHFVAMYHVVNTLYKIG